MICLKLQTLQELLTKDYPVAWRTVSTKASGCQRVRQIRRYLRGCQACWQWEDESSFNLAADA